MIKSRVRTFVPAMIAALLCCGAAAGRATDTSAPPSKFFSPEDGWLDISAFLDSRYGFMPFLAPISEPAVGYGLAGGPAFISKAPGAERPDVTLVGGFGTANGSWGGLAGDSRYWRKGRLQTLAGLLYASVNLDYYGIGEDAALSDHPLRYNLEPKGGLVQAKYRLGESRFWAGLGYAFISTRVSFDLPSEVAGLTGSSGVSNVGGIGPSVSFDTRDNIFTPTRGTYAEALAGFSSEALGGDGEFQRVQLTALQYVLLPRGFFLGLRGQAAAAFGDAPFYVEPFILMRGVPAMRYQGEDLAQIEGELRWQFWKRLSLLGFAGCGAAWNDGGQFEKTQTAVAGGGGVRYELARKYGIHVGLDLAFGPDEPNLYIVFGSPWMRP